MIHRWLYILLVVQLCAVAGRSQSVDQSYDHWSIGISAGDILHHLFNSDNSNEHYAAFVLEYQAPKHGIQFGFRPGYNLEDTQHEGFIDTEITEQISLSGDLAFTWTIFSEPRWLIRAGLKSSGGWSREDITEDSGFDEIITRRLQWNAGIGPVIDFRFYVHPRISLGTEASLQYVYSKSELQQLFTNFPDFDNTKDIVEMHEVEVNEPATIYLRFHF